MDKNLYNGVPLPKLPEAAKNSSVLFITNHMIMDAKYYSLMALSEEGTIADSLYTTGGNFTYLSWIVGADDYANDKIKDVYTLDETGWYNSGSSETEQLAASGIIWANTDLLNADGSVHIVGSKPLDFYSFKLGVALGLAGKGLPKMAQPTAYLYNGVKLPALPEWDREVYPYAVITLNTNTYTLSLFRSAYKVAIWSTAAPGIRKYIMNGDIGKTYLSCVCYDYDSIYFESFEWGECFEHLINDDDADGEANLHTVNRPIWSNYDITHESGEVWCTASDPVPVYD